MIEPAMRHHRRFQRVLARMAEGRVTDIMGEAERLGQVFIQPQQPGNHAPDLRNLEAMGQTGTVMVTIGRDEDLRLALQPAEGNRMDDAVPVTLEFAPRATRPFAVLIEFTATRSGRISSEWSACHR